MPTEQALQARQLSIYRQRFNGSELGTVRLGGEHQAGTDGLAIDDDRASAADAHFTAHMRPRELQLMTEEIRQQ
jgi:hypothetical protein